MMNKNQLLSVGIRVKDEGEGHLLPVDSAEHDTDTSFSNHTANHISAYFIQNKRKLRVQVSISTLAH